MPQTTVPKVRPTSRKKLDRWADRFLTEHYSTVLEDRPLDVEHLVDVHLARHHRVYIVVEDLPHGVEGITELPDRLILPSKVHDKLREDGRARFTGVHEAVHAMIHLPHLAARYVSRAQQRLHRREELPPYLDPEWQANYGAAALLMPARAVWDVIERYGDDPKRLMSRFGVTYTAADIRMDDAREGRLWRPDGGPGGAN